MIIWPIQVGKTVKHVIELGRQGENKARQIQFDLTQLIDTYGEGSATLVFQRYRDPAPYIVPTERDGNLLLWTITKTDTAVAGDGKAEVRWHVNDALAKTVIFRTTTAPSLSNSTNFPYDLQTLYERLVEYVDEKCGKSSSITTLNDTPIVSNAVEAVGTPVYVSDVAEYESYGITETGWYVFARITGPSGAAVTSETVVTGAAGVIKTEGESYVDVAVLFGVAAYSQTVTVDWDGKTQTNAVFKATDLAIRNLDYRTTFYLYDIAPFATWTYGLATGAKFVAGKNYYILEDGEYKLATVTADEDIPADTYYVHTKLTFSGMARNITYQFNEIVDCPSEFILPTIEDDGYGAWFEIRLRHAGKYSCTLVPTDPDVKIATEHTQAENTGFNMIDLHYMCIDGVKIWRFMNTHSTVPA